MLENVGDALSIALNALEDANAEILQGILSTTKFNAVNTKGEMCVMNMIFHNIRNANIQQGDTILDPKLVENGQLRKYDIVVANPPFSQNYTTAGMRFKERFVNWMSQKKQAQGLNKKN